MYASFVILTSRRHEDEPAVGASWRRVDGRLHPLALHVGAQLGRGPGRRLARHHPGRGQCRRYSHTRHSHTMTLHAQKNI